MKVLLDVNVVLDVLLERQAWLAEARAIWDAAEAGHLECCLPASSLTDIFYIARKLVGQERAHQIVNRCLDELIIVPVDRVVLAQACARPESDFEDAVQIIVALAAGVDAIVTRDEAGFAQSPVPVASPIELHQKLLAASEPALPAVETGSIATLEASGYLLVFPCFAIMSSDCRGGVILELTDGTAAAVLLSDEDLLDRYRIEHKLVGPTVRFDHAGQLALYLNMTPQRLSCVAIDPSPAEPTIVSKADVIRRAMELANADETK